jgi:GNAT superfamily N-acetyltransferase
LTASEEDVALGSRLQEKFFRGFPGFTSVREMVVRLLERDFAFFVMEQEGEPAGFVIGASHCRSRNSRCVRTPGEGILTSIAVSERFRRKGLATALCHHLMEYMRAQGNHLFIYGGCGMGSPSMRLARSLTEETWLIRHVFFGKAVTGDW